MKTGTAIANSMMKTKMSVYSRTRNKKEKDDVCYATTMN